MRPTGRVAGLLALLVVLTVGACVEGSRSVASGPSGGGPLLAEVALADLPPEAAETVALIEAGGPFPYRQDGATFENREGLLPPGTYREYTVETPGSDDRGARRIVVGADGRMYWTDDHYASFAWIVR